MDDKASRPFWLAIIGQGALNVALIAGVMAHAMGAELLAAIGTGGGTFATAVTLGMTAWKFIHD
jgi:hypothetical protein